MPNAQRLTPNAQRLTPNAASLCQNILDDVAVHVRQAIVAPSIEESLLGVVDAHQVQDRGVQVVDMDLVLHGVPAELVGRAIRQSSLDSAARHPHREAEGMMFPP